MYYAEKCLVVLAEGIGVCIMLRSALFSNHDNNWQTKSDVCAH